MEILEVMKTIAQDDNISDLHLTVNSKPIIRYNGELEVYEQFSKVLKFQDMEVIAKELMKEGQWEKFEDLGEMDFSYSIPGTARFRINVYQQRGAISLAIRVIPTKVPTIEELGLPDVLRELALQRNGLVLCTGPTGSGKSTTLASMINVINENKTSHIITLEDPIEYLHNHKKSLVHQREIGSDTKSFANALRASLRQDPDIILVGEMRDLETISIALKAAETGHLVLTTLHTNDAPQTIDRIIDVFPPHQQQQVRVQLASVLNGILSQQLLPRWDGNGRVAAMEILIGTPAVRNLIRDEKGHQLHTAMQTGARYGMITMDNYLLDLYNRGLISEEIVLRRASNREFVQKRIHNFSQ
ncbi:MAG: type IV pilus twitching motility protein PilT [Halanaerobium sp.]|nr:type IV pilus twitching motility protein PilT [Halanaerobium sp.]